ncbi:hypothetical protein Ocin01_04570 [Orchesella cincta]|uniref:Uncharacterized protein n=1 Tax=Orchesella cincta TaxID=48709 RepID=A0A1D2N9Z8_ORCCI|nr:hypothetical protein Ocin01_04570 [Orchesella cincta]
MKNLKINLTALYESGYSLNSVSCCYRAIERVHQSPDHYNEYADLQIIFSQTCKPMDVVTNLEDEFIRVICTSKYYPWSGDVVYRSFHAVPLPNRSSRTIEKLFYWKKHLSDIKHKNSQNVEKSHSVRLENNSTTSNSVPVNSGNDPSHKLSSQQNVVEKDSGSQNTKLPKVPPNVVLLGIDSMSRLSFQRNMKKTRQYLQEIGAVEMLGYTKVGENTFPNAVAFISGYQVQDLTKICFFSQNTRQDLCPFLWKKFSEANYLTALIEDVPLLATYNYFKTGFVEQPTDYYFRPYMLGVHYHSPSVLFSLDCIGSNTVDETIHKYIGDLLSMSARNETPVFIYTWLTNLAHGDLNAARHADESYLQFLKSLDLSNTILFFMSDHGYRYGMIRETFPGWQEDKLPNMWVHIPKNIQKQFPTWLPSIEKNSVRLTSPLDLYKTLVHILNTFTTIKNVPDSKSFQGDVIPRKLGQTLFEEVPLTRKCPEAGISENFCACVAPRRLPTNNSNIIAAAKTAIVHINEQLPKVCAKLTLHKVTAGGIMDDTEHSINGSSIVTYVVAFETTPGEFLFEATVESDAKLQSYSVVGELLRMNKITTDVSCVKNDFLEKFCFCLAT